MAVQIPLLKPERLAPLPTDAGHYVAALQNKRGELDALAHASAGVWERLTPLLQIVGPKDRKDPLRRTSVRDWMARIGAAVGEHPVYLDLLRPPPSFPVEVGGGAGTAPLLEAIYGAARRRAMRFIPVAWAGESTQAHLKLVADAAAHDGHGVAIRYRILGVALPPAVGQADFLGRLLDTLAVEAAETDLVIDLDYLDPDVELDVDDMADMVGELEEAAPWRSVVLLGTSIPSMMSCVAEGTVGRLPRREWELWAELVDAGLPRAPAFGDYAVQHPRPPQDGGGPGMRANVRYTTDRGTLVARGEGSIIQEGKEQYRDLCAQLVRTPEFAGGAYSWGDEVIRDCASGALEPGAQNVWRGAGTSHHLQLVTDQLRQRQAQP